MKDIKEFLLMANHPNRLLLKLVFLWSQFWPSSFLIYINDLPEGITSNVNSLLMISIFSTVYNINISTSNLNSDLQQVCEWAFKWKMSFNPGPT